MCWTHQNTNVNIHRLLANICNDWYSRNTASIGSSMGILYIFIYISITMLLEGRYDDCIKNFKYNISVHIFIYTHLYIYIYMIGTY